MQTNALFSEKIKVSKVKTIRSAEEIIQTPFDNTAKLLEAEGEILLFASDNNYEGIEV